MKRINLMLFLMLCLFSMGYAQTDGTTQTATEVDATELPVMSFEAIEIDYGVIEHNADPYREFHFTNTGNAPLVISNAKGSCGCTVPEWSKAPVLPGESDIIKVRYATDRIGKFHKTITLTTNDAEGTHVLKIKGEVLKDDAGDSVPTAAPSVVGEGLEKH